MNKEQRKTALQFAEALDIRREDAKECEIAKLSALDMVDFRPEYLDPINTKYRALCRLINWMENKLNQICEEN